MALEPRQLVGYVSLIDALHLPVPDQLALLSEKRRQYRSVTGWCVLTPRHVPEDSLYSHVVFALK